MTTTLRELLDCAEAASIPDRLRNSPGSVASGYTSLLERVASSDSPRIYGVDLTVGHRIREGSKGVFSAETQRALIRSHAIGSGPAFTLFQTRCIGLAKAYAVAAGGSLISQPLYEIILQALQDKNFQPRLPRQGSYSCGDVIPGAHWADAVVEFAEKAEGYELQPGEALALMNGAFVHVGYSASMVTQILRLWAGFIEATKMLVRLTDQPSELKNWEAPSGRSACAQVIEHIFEFQSPRGPVVQPPVSIRAIGAVLDGFYSASESFTREIDLNIFRPSSNPLLVKDGDTFVPVPSGSFMVPALSIKTSGMIEAVMFLAWTIVAHTVYLHRGHDGIALDLKSDQRPFGSVQQPKYMQGLLEELRSVASTRTFASGGATSFGEEDLWSRGVLTINTLARALDLTERVLIEYISSLVQAAQLAGKEHFVRPALRDANYKARNQSETSASVLDLIELGPATVTRRSFPL